ncbi:Uncharacterised protein [Mycobacterium tuberculosis]|uniref:Uncharacterized protein n=1 Tax=Mycobacterium tuberculosis TaxID=1773 RepID=A0A655EGV5_MYCTX|nr:Uncharacterised protein [Mycobacterium tuberculosis]
MLEGIDVEIRFEFPVDHGKHVAIELSRHPARIVVGAHQPGRVLDQVGAQQQAIARPHYPGQGRQELRARPGREVADRGPQEHKQAPSSPGNLG